MSLAQGQRVGGQRVGSRADAAHPWSPARHRAVMDKVEEAAVLMQDNHDLQTFLQSCQEVGMQHSWWHPWGVPTDTAEH